MLSRKRPLCCRRVFVQQDYIYIPPSKQVDVPARSTLLSPRKVGADWIVDSHQVSPGIYVGRTLLPASHHDLKVHMVNTTAERQLLTSGTCLGSLQLADVIEEPTSSLASGSLGAGSGSGYLAAGFPDDLTTDQREQVRQLLLKYDDIFSRGAFDMGCTSLVEHFIDTGDQRLIR